MSRTFQIALRTTAVTLVLTGLLYPLLVTGLAQILFPDRAMGSLVQDERGRPVGSELIGQRFSSAAYFHGRPSAAGPEGYDATASSGFNDGPTSARLRERVQRALTAMGHPSSGDAVPADLVTASASGLDPHLTLEGALWQVDRVARARGLAPERVSTLVNASVEGRDLFILGEPRVNVLLLNLALNRQFGRPTARP